MSTSNEVQQVQKATEATKGQQLYHFLSDPNLTKDKIMEYIDKIPGAGWDLVGSDIGCSYRTTNFGSIEKNQKNESIIAENMSNMKDAVMRRCHHELEDSNPELFKRLFKMNQVDAAFELFGVPKEGLSGLDETARTSLAQQV